MFKNYLVIAFRNILKHKFFAAINIIGLVIGMACCLLIFVYVQDELSYDRFHKNYENMYRIALHGKIAGQEIITANTSLPLGPAMKNEIPGIESYVRLMPASRSSGMAMTYEDKIFTEKQVFYSDSNFFTFFTFPLLQGDRKTALREPNSVVITSALAKKYFGSDEEAIGKTLIIGVDKMACKVTGVSTEAPSNSHFHFNAIISFYTVEKNYFDGWTGNSIMTYVMKTGAAGTSDIDRKLEDLVQKYVGKELEAGLGISFEEFRKQGGIYSYYIYPIADSHLYSGLVDDMEPSNDIRYIYIFSGVGLFILLIACINFMNLSTARSAGRAKEVGLRKTFGSQRSQMVWQFLSESFIYSLIAIVLATGLSFIILPFFNILSGKALSLSELTSPTVLAAAAGLILIVGMMAGSYPAFYLTSFNAVEVLKGKLRSGMKSKGVRSSLVVIQFFVSTFLIIATMVVNRQLTYMQSKNLGLDKENVITVTSTRRLGDKSPVFKTQLEGLAGVQKVSFTDNLYPGTNSTTVVRAKGKEADHLVGMYYADWDHLDVMKISIKEGRYFSREFKSDSATCVINEAAVKEYGFDNPIGAELLDFNPEKPQPIKIIGVVKDFNFESLKSNVRPLVIRMTDKARFLMVRYSGNPQQMITNIEQQWKSIAPGEPFEYSFLDQEFDSLFRSEMRLRDIFTVFSTIAILIACLGLFALAAFTTEQRTKEIGVRKALGASVLSLTVLLSMDFTRLVLIAIVPALALGWFGADWWLKDFAFRTEVEPLLFILCALSAILIAWITVSYQSVKAAMSDPVKSLRYE